jgi:hypothetical protein
MGMDRQVYASIDKHYHRWIGTGINTSIHYSTDSFSTGRIGWLKMIGEYPPTRLILRSYHGFERRKRGVMLGAAPLMSLSMR